MTNRAYIKVKNKKERNIIEETLLESFKEIDIQWQDDIAKIAVLNCDSFQLKLIKLLSFNLQDLGIKTSILIVPFFDQVFIKYLDNINNFVMTIFEVFVNNINTEMVLKDSRYIFNLIPPKDLDTLKAFLLCNSNSSAAASELYLHRNSFNYRMNHLISLLDINIRDLNTLMFLNLVINICA